MRPLDFLMLVSTNQFSKWDLNTLADTWLGLSVLIKIQKNGKNKVTDILISFNLRRCSAILSVYFVRSDPSKRLHHPPQYDQNSKKLKKRTDISIVTNLRSLSMNIHLLFGKAHTLSAPPHHLKNEKIL